MQREPRASSVVDAGRQAPDVSGRPETPATGATARRFSLRAVLVAFVLIPINSLWIVHTEIVRYAGHPTTTSLYFNVIFCLFVLVSLNTLVRRLAPAWALRQSELLVVYTVLSLGSSMVGHDMLQVLLATLVHPFRYADDSNRWQTLFFQALPRWLTMDDEAGVRAYFLGNTSLYHTHFLIVWARPVL